MTNDDIPADKLPHKGLSTSKAERIARSEETNRAALSTIENEAKTRRK
jgi:transcriptional regulator